MHTEKMLGRLRNLTVPNVVEKIELLHTTSWNIKWCGHFGEPSCSFLKCLISALDDPASLLLGFYSRITKAFVCLNPVPSAYIAQMKLSKVAVVKFQMKVE